MSYSDYLEGLNDGITIGFKAGRRFGFLEGYEKGYSDSSLGLPYKPQKRLFEYEKKNSLPYDDLNIPKPWEEPFKPLIEPLKPEPLLKTKTFEPFKPLLDPLKPEPLFKTKTFEPFIPLKRDPFGAY